MNGQGRGGEENGAVEVGRGQAHRKGTTQAYRRAYLSYRYADITHFLIDTYININMIE